MQSSIAISEGLALNGGPTLPDLDLSARFARGDADALEQVVVLYHARVRRLATRLLGWDSRDAEDIVQDVFLAAMSGAQRFRGGASLWTWLTQITLNRCRSRQRRRAVWDRWKRLWTQRTGDQFGAAILQDVALRDETSQRVRDAVTRLPARQREVVVLYYLEERPLSDIAALLSVTENVVQARLHRARQKLKVSLAPYREGFTHA